MTQPPEEDTGLVLNVMERGESFWCLSLLSQENGLYYPLVRKSKRSVRPDLFDTAQATRSKAKQGSLVFLSDYRPIRRRSLLAKSYERVVIASRYADIVRRNAQHLPDPSAVFTISERFFDSVESDPAPEAAFLKTIYLLAKTEGFPVREDWVSGLDSKSREVLKRILQRTLNEQTEDPGDIATLSKSLEGWLAAEAHFSLPPPL